MAFYQWIIIFFLALAASVTADAATNGVESMESTGTLQISVNLSAPTVATIKITGLEDVSFSKEAGDPALTAVSRSACVYMSEAGQFSVHVTAGPLTSGDSYYDYKIELSDGTAEQSIDIEVSDTEATGQLQGITASTEAGCNGDNPLQLSFYDEGTLDQSFSATATVTLRVVPD